MCNRQTYGKKGTKLVKERKKERKKEYIYKERKEKKKERKYIVRAMKKG